MVIVVKIMARPALGRALAAISSVVELGFSLRKFFHYTHTSWKQRDGMKQISQGGIAVENNRDKVFEKRRSDTSICTVQKDSLSLSRSLTHLVHCYKDMIGAQSKCYKYTDHVQKGEKV